MNDFETVKKHSSLKAYAEAKLERRGRSYICPACKSGTGKNRTPAFSIEPKTERWMCFACGQGGDVFDLAGIVTGDTDKRRELEEVARFFNVPLEEKKASAAKQPNIKPDPVQDYSKGREAAAQYISKCQAALDAGDVGKPGRDYLEARGITAATAAKYGIGYNPQTKRVVIPWSDKPTEWYYIERDITKDTHTQGKYSKPKSAEVGAQPVFNAKAVSSAELLFIVEGIFDAIAIMECGFEATFLGSTTHRPTIEAIKSRSTGVVVPLLDPDEAGQRAMWQLLKDLKPAGLKAINPGEEYTTHRKDPAEMFATDRTGFEELLQNYKLFADELEEEARTERYNEAMKRASIVDPATAAAALYSMEGCEEPIPTGFDNLDRVLGGGLRPGLVTIGAISSLGKTTLAVQMADNIAASGKPVLFVTIEQSASEIVAKSLTRIMGRALDRMGATPVNDLFSPARRDEWSEDRHLVFVEACNEYTNTVAPYLRIMEANEQPGVTDIEAAAEVVRSQYGTAPIVFIDYLQLLKAQSDRDTDKRAIDRNVTAVRQMARRMHTPVIVISSLNRASYTDSISLESFKESGSIEYSSDVLLGLQPRNMETRLSGSNNESARKYLGKQIVAEAKEGNQRELELKVLKNRNGGNVNATAQLIFDGACSTFRDA